MAFQEKSAWVMGAALLLGGIFYFWVVVSVSATHGRLVPPFLPVVGVYTVILVVIAVIGHIVIAAIAPKEANAPLDEREKKIVERASHWSGYVLGIGVILSLGMHLFFYDGNMLFYIVFASLMISQLSEYVIQIVLYRARV